MINATAVIIALLALACPVHSNRQVLVAMPLIDLIQFSSPAAHVILAPGKMGTENLWVSVYAIPSC